jgi:hypothetical protein
VWPGVGLAAARDVGGLLRDVRAFDAPTVRAAALAAVSPYGVVSTGPSIPAGGSTASQFLRLGTVAHMDASSTLHAIAGGLGVPEPHGEQLARLVAAVGVEDLQVKDGHTVLDALRCWTARREFLQQRA